VSQVSNNIGIEQRIKLPTFALVSGFVPTVLVLGMVVLTPGFFELDWRDSWFKGLSRLISVVSLVCCIASSMVFFRSRRTTVRVVVGLLSFLNALLALVFACSTLIGPG